MCGIVGYIGHRSAAEFLLEGLRRLEYRGYDSAGLALLVEDASNEIAAKPRAVRIESIKAVGRIDSLVAQVAVASAKNETFDDDGLPIDPTLAASVGIGHTRWATHGAPTHANAHPHLGGEGSVAIVHNGVIENYLPLKQRLEAEGYTFRSATDSETIAHLIDSCLRKLPALEGNANEPEYRAARHEQLLDAVAAAVAQLRGTYGLVVMFRDDPDVLIAARLGSPLVVGIGKEEHFIASDASPLVGYTEKIVYLADHQLALVTRDSLRVTHRDLGHIQPSIELLNLELGDVALEGFEHYMLKEIYEQPEALRNAMRGRLSDDDATAVFGGLNLSPQQLRQMNRIILTACGTSWHAALVGEYLIEELARIPVEVEYASELRYRNPPVDRDTLLFAITQSGETADTLAALREMKRKGHPTLAICNVVGSTIAQEADGGVYLHAGPEVGVASTKAYTAQVCVLAQLALFFGRMRHLSYDAGRRIIEELHKLPDYIEAALRTNEEVRRIAEKYHRANNFLYLGRQTNFPTALEGALKLKEISYIHAEGYPAAEMKHGPIALVDEQTPSVFIMPQGFVYEKVMSNLEEIKARGGPVIAVVCEEDTHTARMADDVIVIPTVESFLQPMVAIVPLQLLAYHIAVLRDCDVDRPRNLAKSVTVE